MLMLPYPLATIRRKEMFDSAVEYVKETIPFTFFCSWIKLLPFWKFLQLLHLDFLLVIKGSLQTLSPLTKRFT